LTACRSKFNFAFEMKTNLFGAIQPLVDGSRVALVAPSGILPDAAHVEQAKENVRSLGWVPVLGAHVSELHGYLAGTDEQRVADFNTALRDDTIDAIWCVRGGYGAMRLLRDIDYAALESNPRPVIGFSDITALHAAIFIECNIVSFHGPTARGDLSDFSRNSLVRALADQRDSCGVATNGRVLRAGKARGRLAGGNLALVASLMGTPWSVDFDGAILVLEDIDEAVYRVDRMMRQLLLAGALQKCTGIVAGDFRPPSGETADENLTVDGILAEAAEEAGVPCLAGAPFGHIRDQWTIPLGATAELDADRMSLRVVQA
jgi:muramoyltetrapeptide carboxypeptidase